jgi:hypothetical protein
MSLTHSPEAPLSPCPEYDTKEPQCQKCDRVNAKESHINAEASESVTFRILYDVT